MELSVGNRKIDVETDENQITIRDTLYPMPGYANHVTNNYILTKGTKYYKVYAYNTRDNWYGTGSLNYGKIFIPINKIDQMVNEVTKMGDLTDEENEPELLAKLRQLIKVIKNEFNKQGVQID